MRRLVFFICIVLAAGFNAPAYAADPNFISHWKFDEGSGTKAYDSASDNDGIIYGAIWTTGQIDGALDFDGIGDYVRVDDSASLSFTNPGLTIAAWVYLNQDQSGPRSIVRKNNQWDLGIFPADNKIRNLVKTDGTDGWTVANDESYTIGTNKWYFFAFTYNGSVLKHYANGVQVGSDKTVTGNIVDNSNNVAIGSNTGGGSNNVNGVIDDVRIYDRALTSGDIWQLYLEGRVKAFGPNPTNVATDVSPHIVLSWSAGTYAASHDVYLGTGYNDVYDATTASAEFKGNQDTNDYTPGTLILGESYYWRIDEVNDPNFWKGDVWSFTVDEGVATNPNPTNGASGVSPHVVLSWSAGAYSASHDVYLGTSESSVNNANTASAEFKGNQGTNDYTPGTLVLGERYYWRIDEVNYMTVKGQVWNFRVEQGLATNPSPVDGAIDVSPDVVLSWSAGAYSASHDVYFGTSEAGVNNATTASAEFKGNQGNNNYDPAGTLVLGERYYWRIDEVNYMTVKGQVWNFRVEQGLATNPYPANGASGVKSDVVLSWSAGDYAASHDVYFGSTWAEVNSATTASAEYMGNQGPNSWNPGGGLEFWKTYYWRIDEVNDITVKGDVWRFKIGNIKNFSFEQYADDSQIICRTRIGTSPDTDTLGWSSGCLPLSSGLASVDVNCGPGMCDDDCRDWYVFPDGNTACYIDNGVWVYQLIDHNIVAGYRYDLYFDGMVRYGGDNDTIRAHFYYLQDPCAPDVNHIDIVVKDIKVTGYERPNGKDDWTDDCHLVFVAPASSPYIDEKLGVKFTSPWIGDLVWVDNVRLKWEWAAQAYYPNPEDGELYAPNDANLIWSPGLWAKATGGHDVYFGSTWAEVNSATTSSAEFKGVQSPNEWNPAPGSNVLTLGETYYWRIDEVNENYTKPPGPVDPPPNGIWKGEIWSFEVEGKARDPDPAKGDDDVARNVILHWRRGAHATYHDIYFGSTSTEVTTATTASSGTYKGRQNLSDDDYDAGALGLTVGEDYFWRIDEVNYMTVKGDIWDFTVADYLLVDDFDYYANNTALLNTWDDSTGAEPGNGYIFVNPDANYVPADGNSMGLIYDNDKNPAYSQTTRTYGTPQDWSYATEGVTELEIDWMGDPCNADDPPIYVKLSDGTTTVQVNPSPNNATEKWTHTWHIALKDFNDGGVNLANITKITLGIGDGKADAGYLEEGTLYFDDIRLYPPRCYPEYGPAADFTDDCRVDVNDLLIFSQAWCKSGGWYEASMPAYTPVVEYLFEEGSGTIVANTGSLGSSHNLVIGRGVDKSHNWVTDPNNEPCWVQESDPCRGWTLWFDGRDGSYDNWDDTDPLTGGGGDYLLGPAVNLNSNTVTLATWIKPDPWLIDPKKGEYWQSGGFTGLIHTRDESSISGISYNVAGDYIFAVELGYEWNGKVATWQHHSGISIPDWRWSLAALVIEPDAGILYLADKNDTADPNDDVLHSSIHVYNQLPDEWDGLFGIACDGGIIDGGWTDRFFRGQMDGVRIYDVSLSEFEIMGLAEMEATGYYPLDSEADLCVGRKDPCDPCSPVNDQIDLCDFSKFADEWLETKLWPQP